MYITSVSIACDEDNLFPMTLTFTDLLNDGAIIWTYIYYTKLLNSFSLNYIKHYLQLHFILIHSDSCWASDFVCGQTKKYINPFIFKNTDQ